MELGCDGATGGNSNLGARMGKEGRSPGLKGDGVGGAGAAADEAGGCNGEGCGAGCGMGCCGNGGVDAVLGCDFWCAIGGVAGRESSRSM